MSADRLIDLTRGLRRAVEAFGREVALDEASMPATAGVNPAVTVAEQFMTGYDGAETTLPFTSDVSLEGGDDIVTG